ncbi:MAG: hypothetical protein LBN29_11830 [Mediterranea sp.]|jgi:hypothetical protein|nr:hypothetical protein [Mediterranea sp.]
MSKSKKHKSARNFDKAYGKIRREERLKQLGGSVKASSQVHRSPEEKRGKDKWKKKTWELENGYE